jgi:MFS family permease
LLPHFSLLLLFAPQVLFGRLLARAGGVAVAIGTTILLGVVFALLGGANRQRPVRRSVLPLAFAAAAVVALMPVAASLLATVARPHIAVPSVAVSLLALAAAAVAGTLAFGALLTLFTLFGYDHFQALTALDHPGFKHFVRLRVRADGSGIDGWCIGIADPLRPGARPELVDQFVWRPFAPAQSTENRRERARPPGI